MFMVAAGWKLLGQVVFLAGGIACLRMGEKDAGLLLIGAAVGSLVPVAEKRDQGTS